MINKTIKVAVVAILAIAFTTISHAQVGPGGGIGGSSSTPGGPGSSGGTPVPQDNAVPFDGGLSLILLAAGAGVGAKKTYKN